MIVQGDEIVESTPRERERGMLLRLGDFYWQEPGAKRPTRNIATSRVELREKLQAYRDKTAAEVRGQSL